VLVLHLCLHSVSFYRDWDTHANRDNYTYVPRNCPWTVTSPTSL
jgi:hypothetical protein